MTFEYENLNQAGTVTLKPAAGQLHTITVNTTAAGAITVYDNTAASGKVIAVLKASVAEQTFLYDLEFHTGLTINLAAASDITVTYS